METATAPAATPGSTMTKLQKLAALLIMVGPESAAELLKNLDEDELESVSMGAQLTFISQAMQQEILQEFTDVAVDASTAVVGGAGYARGALERSVGASRASAIIGRIAPAPVPAVQSIIEIETAQLLNLLQGEQPQTIALLVSHLSPEKSSELLARLRPEVRDQVIERLATMGPTSVEAIERVVNVLKQKTAARPTCVSNQTGGLKTAANVLNALGQNLSQSVLLDLERRNPQLGLAIRQKMFTFDDLVLLPVSALQKLMREVDLRDLALALKSANPRVKNVLLSALSRRAAETVNEEISFLGPVRRREIEAAQSRMVAAVRRLESENEIDLSQLRGPSRHEMLV